MRRISSNTVCNYFYIMFLFIAAVAAFTVLIDLGLVVSSGGRNGVRLLFNSAVLLAIPLVNALFFYILCSRSLLEK